MSHSKIKSKTRLGHFSIIAPYYERFIHPKYPETLISVTNLTGKETLLDAGGGTGRVSQFMIGKAKQIIVVDESFEMVQEAKRKEPLRAICSITEHLPLKSNSFDRIIMVDAFHHVADQKKTTQELWRVLKPGGKLVVEEPDIRFINVKLIAFAEKLIGMRSHFIPPPKMREMFRFKNCHVEIQNYGFTAWIIAEKS